MPSDQAKVRLITWTYVLGVLIITGLILFKNYFSLDESELIWENFNGPGPFGGFKRFVSEGRIIYGVFMMATFKVVTTLEALKYIRLLGIAINFFTCFFVFKFLKNKGVVPSLAFLIAVCIFTLPGFSSFMAWAECYPLTFAFLASFYAGTLAVKIFARSLDFAAPRPAKGNLSLLLIFVLEITALFIYQTYALAFLLPVFFVIVLKKTYSTFRQRIMFLMSNLVVFFLCIGIYYKLYHSIITAYNIPLTDRAVYTRNYFEKLTWFRRQLLEASKLQFILFKKIWLQYFACVIMAAVLIRDIVKKRVFDIILLAFFCVLVFFPMLMLESDWSATRYIFLISALMGSYILIRIFEIIPVSYLVTATISTVFIIAMCINLDEGWVKPEREDYKYMKDFVEQLPATPAEGITVEVLSPLSDKLKANHSFLRHYGDEFNDPIFGHVWPIAPAMRVMYKEAHPEIPYVDINGKMSIKIIKDAKEFSPPVPGKLYNLDLNF
jgi:hypothetical protein